MKNFFKKNETSTKSNRLKEDLKELLLDFSYICLKFVFMWSIGMLFYHIFLILGLI